MNGVREPAVSRATRNIVPSPPKTIIKSTFRASVVGSVQTGTLSPARAAVAASVNTARRLAPIKDAARRTSGRLEILSELAMSPTRWICSASFFNQRQKFLVSRRPQQRGLGNSTPTQVRQRAREIFDLAKHTLVNRRVGYDARAFVYLGFAGLELWFDQC